MQFSNRITQLAKLYGVDHKDVLFALLVTSGANHAESYAVIYRPATASTNSALQRLASNLIGARPGLARLIRDLDEKKATTVDTDTSTRRRGRPRKESVDTTSSAHAPLDYNDKDAVLRAYVGIYEGADKQSDRLSALNQISALNQMKREQTLDEQNRVYYWLPLNYADCDLLLSYLDRYYNDMDAKEG